MIHYDSSPGSWNLYTRSNTDPESVQAYLKSLGGQAEASFETPWERFGQWNLFNQHWTAKLVPATASNVSAIVSQHPGPYLNGGLQNYQSPPLQNVSPQDFHFVNGH
jgi:hypothetical protein